MDHLSDFIKQYRRDNAMTQNDLSFMLGITTVTISNLENNKIKAGHRVLKKIAIQCNLDLLEAVRLNENNKQI